MEIIYVLVETPPIFINPCKPSPCGLNALCQVINNSSSCACMEEYVGSPPNCRPECISNAECSSRLACINQNCKDPCPGSCGPNTECRVVSHTPMCACSEGYTGDPFIECNIQPRKQLVFNYDFYSIHIGIYNFIDFVFSYSYLPLHPISVRPECHL